jgi:hypothetical protein
MNPTDLINRAFVDAEEIFCKCGHPLGRRSDIEEYFAGPVAKPGDMRWVRCDKCNALMERAPNGIYFFLGRAQRRRVARVTKGC